jgi:hypothetical protein
MRWTVSLTMCRLRAKPWVVQRKGIAWPPPKEIDLSIEFFGESSHAPGEKLLAISSPGPAGGKLENKGVEGLHQCAWTFVKAAMTVRCAER